MLIFFLIIVYDHINLYIYLFIYLFIFTIQVWDNLLTC